ncbi:MAG: YetF domain-containing protein [bacterium]
MLHDLFIAGIPLTEKLFRTVCVYAFLLTGLRLAGKRELGQFNPFDLVVLLLLSNTVQNAIIGNDNSLVGGIVGASALLVINWAVVRYLFSHPRVARWLEGDADVLIHGGEIKHSRLKRELITHEELESAARKQGIDGLDKVEMCRLEVGGALTFVAKVPSDDEQRHAQLMQRLDELGRAQQALHDRVASMDHRD